MRNISTLAIIGACMGIEVLTGFPNTLNHTQPFLQTNPSINPIYTDARYILPRGLGNDKNLEIGVREERKSRFISYGVGNLNSDLPRYIIISDGANVDCQITNQNDLVNWTNSYRIAKETMK